MEELVKKLEQLLESLRLEKGLADAGSAYPKAKLKMPSIPAIKPPAPPSMTPSKAAAPKIGSGTGPSAKKDPKKVAQQIKDGSMSTKTQKVMLKVDHNGQWELEKKWSTPDAQGLHALDMEDARKKMEHTNTGQRGIKAYTSSVHGTAKEQTDRAHDAQHGASGAPKILSGAEKQKAIAAFKPRANKAGIKLTKNGQWQLEPTDPSNV